MADLEFFFDPVCPWAWVTSRWVTEVQQQRSYDVTWRFICLKIINEDLVADWYDDSYKARHMAGLFGLRVADEIRLQHDNDTVGRYYSALGTAVHNEQRREALYAEPVLFLESIVKSLDLPPHLADAALDDGHDAHLRAETEAAFARTGPGVGTPIITFRPGTPGEASFFGPVIPRIPRGEEALRLWDAVDTLASSGVAEVKRSLRGTLSFD